VLTLSRSLCSRATADTLEGQLEEIKEAAEFGADTVELRIDFLKDLDLMNPKPTLTALLDACKAAGLQALVTFRPEWEGCVSQQHVFASAHHYPSLSYTHAGPSICLEFACVF
jgi:3-dehydroquinate dehydratase